MQAKQISAPGGYVPIKGPQCQGKIVGSQPAYRKAGGDQCWRKSQYEIGGKPYCAFHAGRIALEALLAGSQ